MELFSQLSWRPLMGCWSEVPRYCQYDLNIRCIYVGMQSHEIKSIHMEMFVWWETPISMRVVYTCYLQLQKAVIYKG